MSDDDHEKRTEQDEETHSLEEHLHQFGDRDMPDFIDALNRFVTHVSTMDWPDAFKLDENETFCFTVFRSFWRQHKRERLESREDERRIHMRFQGVDEEELRRFLHRTFGAPNEESESVLNIDPKHHQPDGEHTDADSIKRQQRFQDEWS